MSHWLEDFGRMRNGWSRKQIAMLREMMARYYKAYHPYIPNEENAGKPGIKIFTRQIWPSKHKPVFKNTPGILN